MRISDIALYSAKYAGIQEPLTFSLRDQQFGAQYLIRDITGLDAEEIISKFYGFGLQTSPKFYDFSMKSREIVARVALKPNIHNGETYADARDDLFRAISSNRTGMVTLYLNDGGVTRAQISGFVSKFEATYFNKLPEVQLTFTCPDAMLRGISPVRSEADDLTEIDPLIIPDSISTSPHGFSMEMTFVNDTDSLLIQDADEDEEWRFTVSPDGGFLVDDLLYFSSDYRTKYLYMIRDGQPIYLLDAIQPNSIWPIVFPGANGLYFPENTADIVLNVLEYYPSFWGV